jgi:hypothetical protein
MIVIGSSSEYQPELIEFSVVEDTLTNNQTTTEDEDVGTNLISIGEFIFNNVPFTVSIKEGEIRSLSANVKFADTGTSNVGDDQTKGLKKKVILKYNALPNTTYNLWISNLGKVVELDISTGLDVEYSEAILETDLSSNVDDVAKGEYILDKLTYKSTAADDKLGVTAEFYKFEQFEESEFWDESGSSSLGYIDGDLILDSYNPLEDVVDVIAEINGEIIFEGYLANITSSSLKALGKERELADNVIYSSYQGVEDDENPGTLLDMTLTSLAQEVANESGFLFIGNLDGNGLDANILDRTSWDVIRSCCRDVGYYFYCEGNAIYATKPITSTDDFLDITENILSTSFNFRASEWYDGLVINLSYTPRWDTYGSYPNIVIKCYNKMLIAGEALDYDTMETVATSEPSSDEASFECVVDISDNIWDISATEQSYGFIESTLPLENYWGSFIIEIPRDMGLNISNSSVGYEDVYIIESSELFEYADQVDIVISKKVERRGTMEFDGRIYVHIFADDLDSLSYFDIIIKRVKLPEEDIYDGYRKWGNGTNIFNHSFTYKQSIGSPYAFDRVANHIFNLRNSELKEVKYLCEGKIDVRPGESIKVNGKLFIVKDVTVKVDNKLKVTTDIVAFEYKEFVLEA